jgi:hypothetical protein
VAVYVSVDRGSLEVAEAGSGIYPIGWRGV